MKFTKMQGLGNDYIYLSGLDGIPDRLPELARDLSRRRFSVGSDGLICYTRSSCADFGMKMFNADGSVGKMCGNGIRGVGKLLYDSGLTRKTVLDIETDSGIRRLWLHLFGGKVNAVTVDMGIPVIGGTAGMCPCIHMISVGNPHGVIFCDSLDRLPEITCPGDEINLEFVQILSGTRLRMRVRERGSGETCSCGTGACAAVAAAADLGLCSRRCEVVQPGGTAEVEWSRENGHLYLKGPSVTVCEGECYPAEEVSERDCE